MRRPQGKRSWSFSLLGLLGMLGLVATPLASAAPQEAEANGSISGRLVQTAEAGDAVQGEAVLVAADATPQPFGEVEGETEEWVTADTANSVELAKPGDNADATLVVPVLARAELDENQTFTFEDLTPGDYLVKLETNPETTPIQGLWWKDAKGFEDAEAVTVIADQTTNTVFLFPPSQDSKKPIPPTPNNAKNPQARQTPNKETTAGAEQSEQQSGERPTAETAGTGTASISGKVTVPAGVDVTEIWVTAYDADEDQVGYAYPEEDGTYIITGLLAGTYRVEFSAWNQNVIDQWYNNKADFDSADQITLGTAQNKAGINATLKKGASISGKITIPGDVDVAGIRVEVYDEEGDYARGVYPDTDGNYTVVGLSAGTYKVQFDSWEENVITQWYSNKTDFDTANAIPLTSGQDKSGINATLKKGITISGKVTVPTDVDLTEVWISVYDEDYDYIRGTFPDSDGNYTLAGLPAGTYKVEFSAWEENVVTQWYNNKNDFDSATPIALKVGGDKTGINATLERGAKISGKVTVPDGLDVTKVEVTAYDEAYDHWRSTYPDPDGNYTIAGLAAGTYKVEFSSWEEDLTTQWYNNKADFESATPVTVKAEDTKSGVNANMKMSASFYGTVTAPPGTDLTKINIEVFDSAGDYASWTSPGPDGNYEVTGLPAGTYKVQFTSSSQDITDQWYSGKEDYASATPIKLEAGQKKTDINVTLKPGASISGKITIPQGADLTEVWINIYSSDHEPISGGTVGPDGKYRIYGLNPGTYKVQFGSSSVDDGLATQWYKGKDSFTSATPITLMVSENKSGIDATLKPGGGISGTVKFPSGTQNGWACLDVYALNNEFAVSTCTDDNGKYEILGLPAGKYKVAFYGGTEVFKPQWYKNKTNFVSATEVEVAVGQVTKNVDATMQKAGAGKFVKERYAGSNRYETNYKLNAEVMRPGMTVFIATGASFPDALSIGPAVATNYGVLVLTPRDGLPTQTLQLLKERQPSKVYVVGGKGAVSDKVIAQVKTATGLTATRVSGANRYETSIAILEEFFTTGSVRDVFIATGTDFPDALSASAAGGAAGAPVLLVNGKNQSSLPAKATKILNQQGVVKVHLVGGTGVVGKGLQSTLSKTYTVDRLSGASRYGTNLAVNEFLNEEFESSGWGDPQGLWIATGQNFPDALSAAGPAGDRSQRLVLSNGSCVMKEAVNWANNPKSLVTTVNLIGGTGALNQSVYNLTPCK